MNDEKIELEPQLAEAVKIVNSVLLTKVACTIQEGVTISNAFQLIVAALVEKGEEI